MGGVLFFLLYICVSILFFSTIMVSVGILTLGRGF